MLRFLIKSFIGKYIGVFEIENLGLFIISVLLRPRRVPARNPVREDKG
jgi:hypothetical protein